MTVECVGISGALRASAVGALIYRSAHVSVFPEVGGTTRRRQAGNRRFFLAAIVNGWFLLPILPLQYI